MKSQTYVAIVGNKMKGFNFQFDVNGVNYYMVDISGRIRCSRSVLHSALKLYYNDKRQSDFPTLIVMGVENSYYLIACSHAIIIDKIVAFLKRNNHHKEISLRTFKKAINDSKPDFIKWFDTFNPEEFKKLYIPDSENYIGSKILLDYIKLAKTKPKGLRING